MQTVNGASRILPLFIEFGIDDLAKRTGYSLMYLVQLREGYVTPKPLFRKRMAAILGKTEEELFGAAA